MQMRNHRCRVACCLLITVAALSLMTVSGEGTGAITELARAAEAPASQGGDPDKPAGGTAIARGMGKEAVRTIWGQPEEIRQLRTCFGWQEEWVYRGDPKRFGGTERILLFDEGEVLREIK
jgi:hypothetical protein